MMQYLAIGFSVSVFLAAAPVARAGEARQMVLVIARDWTTTAATVYRLERATPKEAWRTVGRPMQAVLGRTGLAWDAEARQAAGGLPVKREGDGKSPAGIFSVSTIYGTAEAGAAAVKALKMPYRQITGDLECVDDVKSAEYNRMVERSRVAAPDWNSSEKIQPLSAKAYRWLAVVDYNPKGARRGAGSCIFLHVASAEGKPTAGCTAFAESDLLELFAWMDPGRSPVLVQTAADGLEGLKRSHPRLLAKLPALAPAD